MVCNARKSSTAVDAFKRVAPARAVKGKYGEPEHWDGFSALFVLLARGQTLSTSEKGWLAALVEPP